VNVEQRKRKIQIEQKIDELLKQKDEINERYSLKSSVSPVKNPDYKIKIVGFNKFEMQVETLDSSGKQVNEVFENNPLMLYQRKFVENQNLSMHAGFMTELAEKFPGQLKGLLVYVRDINSSIWYRAYIIGYSPATQLFELEFLNEQSHTQHLKFCHNTDRRNRRREFIIDYHLCNSDENQIHFNDRKRVKFIIKLRK